MTDQRRELIFKLTEGKSHLLTLAHELTRYERCDEIMSWLIYRRIRGDDLIEYFSGVWKNRVLSMVQFILMRVDRSREVQPILHGSDYK